MTIQEISTPIIEKVHIKSMYGLSLGDIVKYIGDEGKHITSIVNKMGSIVEIEPCGGQFHVQFEDLSYMVSFGRQDLLLENEVIEKVDFNGMLARTDNLTIDQMRSYLNKYHKLKEGIDFGISDRDNIKEVFLINEAYVELMKELFAVEIATNVLADEKIIQSFKDTFRTNIGDGDSISSSFKISNWTFITHVLGWQVQKHLCFYFGVDLMNEFGFQNIR